MDDKKLITDKCRKSIKKMAEISQVARVLNLVPTPEEFALRLIDDMKRIANLVNSISTRINDILDRYSSIPTEFLLAGFDEIIEKLNNINDYTKFTITETMDVLSSFVGSTQDLVGAVGSATSAVTSTVLQIGGGLTYGVAAGLVNLDIAQSPPYYQNTNVSVSGLGIVHSGREKMTEDIVQDIIDGKISLSDINQVEQEIDNRVDERLFGLDNFADTHKDETKNLTETTTEAIDGFFENVGEGLDEAQEWLGDKKDDAVEFVDENINFLIEKVENAKKKIEEKIEDVRTAFNKLTKKFDDAFGFVNGKHYTEGVVRNVSNTALEKMDGPVFDALGEITNEIADFIANFNVGKVVTALGGIVVGAGAATLAMDLLPSIDVDKMLKNIIAGIDDSYQMDKMTELYYNKYYGDGPELEEYDKYIDLSEDEINARDEYINELEKYRQNEELYAKFFEDYDANNPLSYNIEIYAIKDKERKENEKEFNKTRKSALKKMRKLRREAIKAKQIERYRGFFKIEMDNLKKECNNLKDNIKYEWDSMMKQYTDAVDIIAKFFSKEGCGGSECVDKCCDRINDDADQIKELCKNIGDEIAYVSTNVAIPYTIGTSVDMPVHKILEFFKDVKIIVTFLKNLIRLGIDIISQLSILAKIIANGFQSLKEIMDKLKEIIGVDKILNMIEFLVELFRPKMIDVKLLLENSISPIYYNETEDYENRYDYIDGLLENDEGGIVEKFYYTDNPYAKKNEAFGGKNYTDEDEIEELLEILKDKGEREVSAYRTPILNEEGDNFAGWIFYYANAKENYLSHVKKDRKKRRRNKLIEKASKKNKMVSGKLVGGVAQLKKNDTYFKYKNEGNLSKPIYEDATGFDAYYWYTKWTNDPTDCVPDFSNVEYVYDENGNLKPNVNFNENVVSPVQTTLNGSLVELSDGRRVFVDGQNVKSGDFVVVEGIKYRVK